MTPAARLLAIAVGLVACDGMTTDVADEWDDLGSFEDKFVPQCEKRRALVRFVYDHKSCFADSECVHAG
nr:hypothetical protein [Polyangiaceae bacterium]